jgi:four helix bundle protein
VGAPRDGKAAQSVIRSHRDLLVWQNGMQIAVQIYRLTECFPSTEIYRLTSQITRAAISVPANIAEGYGRSATRDYARFLSIAKGSLMETETFLMLAIELGYLTETQAAPTLHAITETDKMLTALRSRIMQPR